MITVKEARGRAGSRLKRKMAAWATGEPDVPAFNLGLRPPPESKMLEDPDAVDGWVHAWKDVTPPLEVEYVERRWRTLGAQVLPNRLIVGSPDDLAGFVGGATARNWRTLRDRAAALMQVLGESEDVRQVIRSRGKRLLDLPETNFVALLAVLEWLKTNSIEGLRPRQLPIRGVDSKWLGEHRDLVEKLHAASSGGAGLGVVDAKKLIRLRVLDPTLSVGGLTDFACLREELATLAIRPRTVFIFENLESVLAMPQWPGAIVIHGSGYAVSVLGDIPWLKGANVIYWGDLDADGFAILHVLRSHLPKVTSVLMDEETLLEHRDLWVADPSPRVRELSTLTAEEQSTLERLRGEGNVRLEQERIPWKVALEELRKVAATS